MLAGPGVSSWFVGRTEIDGDSVRTAPTVIRIADADADVRNVLAFHCSGSLPTSPVS